MDALVTSIVNNGVSATVAATFIYLVWHFVTKTLPETRREYLTSIERIHSDCAKERAYQIAAHEKAYGQLSDALNNLSGEVKGISNYQYRRDTKKDGG